MLPGAEPAWLALRLAAPDFAWAAGSAAGLHRIPFDPSLLLAEFPPPHTAAALVRALGALGLHVAAVPGDVTERKLPCLVLLRAGAGEEPGLVPVIVTAATPERIVFFQPGSLTPTGASPAELAARAPAAVLELAPAAEPLADADGPRASSREFGFRWFVPELLKHRAVWRAA